MAPAAKDTVSVLPTSPQQPDLPQLQNQSFCSELPACPTVPGFPEFRFHTQPPSQPELPSHHQLSSIPEVPVYREELTPMDNEQDQQMFPSLSDPMGEPEPSQKIQVKVSKCT
jgi:hypothetical protein